MGERMRTLLSSPWLGTVLRATLAAVMAWAALAKITDLRSSGTSVAAYGLVSPEAARTLGGALPYTEAAIGLLLLAGLATRMTAVFTAALLALYLGAIASAWARGLSISCGCFGGGGAVTHDATRGYVVDMARDFVLMAMAVLLALRPATRYGLDALLPQAPEARRAD
jgi:uncharacterized membrane protein YphA (DoxX/SURF4 family)